MLLSNGTVVEDMKPYTVFSLSSRHPTLSVCLSSEHTGRDLTSVCPLSMNQFFLLRRNSKEQLGGNGPVALYSSPSSSSFQKLTKPIPWTTPRSSNLHNLHIRPVGRSLHLLLHFFEAFSNTFRSNT